MIQQVSEGVGGPRKTGHPLQDLTLKGGDRQIQHYGSGGNVWFKVRNRTRQGLEETVVSLKTRRLLQGEKAK